MSQLSGEERRELGAFVRSRRRRLEPPDLGTSHGQRRTPGLRREEVALLAGISVSWYTWLEQGREISVSAATLDRLAAALRLDRAETGYLMALSARQRETTAMTAAPSEGVLRLVQAVNPVPAYLRNDRLDILAWNRAVADLFVDYGRFAPEARNTLHLMFLYTPYRTLIAEWEHVARSTVQLFRAGRARAPDKAPFDRLVEEIAAESEEFRRWWSEGDVQGFDEGVKRLVHPTHGRLDLSYVAMAPEGRPDLSFVTYLLRQ